MSYGNKIVSQQGALEFRTFFTKDGHVVSPFHDIPLWADKEKGLIHMVVEIPRGTNAKLEISRDEPMNPIKQDVKNGKLRFVHDKYPFNYGAHPQTWENPTIKHPDTNANGDNDPLDAVDISSIQHKTGEVIVVKVLGTYAMIDEGETDWKIVGIDVNDPLAAHLNDIDDIDKHFPGKTDQVFTFLRDYKIPDGKPANVFAYNGALQNRAFALKVIEETHEQWHALVSNKIPNKTERYTIATSSTTLNSSSTPYTVTAEEAERHVVESFLKYLRAKN